MSFNGVLLGNEFATRWIGLNSPTYHNKYKRRSEYKGLFLVPIKNYKQLLDEVFVISRIIKVEVRVISRSRRLRLITLTETLIILDITKTESNNCFIIH